MGYNPNPGWNVKGRGTRALFGYGSGLRLDAVGFGRRAKSFGDFDGLHPVFPNEPAQLDVVQEIERFDEEGICPERIGAVDIANLVGGGQNDDGNAADSGLGPNPLQ